MPHGRVRAETTPHDTTVTISPLMRVRNALTETGPVVEHRRT